MVVPPRTVGVGLITALGIPFDGSSDCRRLLLVEDVASFEGKRKFGLKLDREAVSEPPILFDRVCEVDREDFEYESLSLPTSSSRSPSLNDDCKSSSNFFELLESADSRRVLWF